MSITDRHTRHVVEAVALLVLSAIFLRASTVYLFPQLAPLPGGIMGMLRSILYLGLYMAWGESLRRRILQKQLRQYLVAVSYLLVFWIAVRTLRFYFFESSLRMQRYCWYTYYLPMQGVPLLALLIGLLLGKPEDYRLPRWAKMLFIPTAAFLLLVLTNDLHGLVFTFADSTEDYGYGAGYWLAVMWEIGCAAAALCLILSKCRVPGTKKLRWLPLLPFGVALLYGALYILRPPFLKLIAGDITAFQCLTYAAILESCIQCGLIRANTHYGELFAVSTLAAVVTDEDYNVRFASETAPALPPEKLHDSQSGPVLLPDGKRLSAADIPGGHVLWQEDVSELLELLEQLDRSHAALAAGIAREKESYRAQARYHSLQEQNRLYDSVRQVTAGQVALLGRLLTAYDAVDGDARRRQLLCSVVVVGAYLKRRSNLVFIAEQSPLIPVRELTLCLEESTRNLALGGTECGLSMELSGEITAASLTCVYEFFESAVERTLGVLDALYLRLYTEDRAIYTVLTLECSAELSDLACADVTAQLDSDGLWRLCLRLPTGDAA